MMKILILSFLVSSFLSLSCDNRSDKIQACAPFYLPENYHFCLDDSVDLIQQQGAAFLDQGTYRITDNDIYTLDLNNAMPFFYSEFEVKNGKIVAMSFRTAAINDQRERDDVWNRYKDETNNFFDIHYQEAKIPERISNRLEKSIVWSLGNGIFVEMKSHMAMEGESEGISLDYHYD